MSIGKIKRGGQLSLSPSFHYLKFMINYQSRQKLHFHREHPY